MAPICSLLFTGCTIKVYTVVASKKTRLPAGIEQPGIANTESLVVDCMSDAHSFEQLKQVWQSLERADPCCKPFNTWHWLSLWWACYQQSDFRLAIIVVRQGRRVVAIAPFYTSTVAELRVLRIRVLRFIGTGGDTSPDYMNIVALPQYRETAERLIINFLPQVPAWTKLLLRDVATPSSLSKCIEQFVQHQAGFAQRPAPHLILTARLPQTWEEYRARLTRKRRKQINHRRNRLDAAGQWALSICASEADLQEATEGINQTSPKTLAAQRQIRALCQPCILPISSSRYQPFFRRTLLVVDNLEIKR